MKSIGFLIIFLLSGNSWAANYSELSKKLYPNSPEEQELAGKFFEIVASHKTHDPFLGGRGPSISLYRLDKIRYAFIYNLVGDTCDLAFFNWDLREFDKLKRDKTLSQLYGSKVYVLKTVRTASIGTQGEKNDELANFSYIKGSTVIEKMYKNSSPNTEVPAEFSDWKPNPNSLDKSAPLRQALGSHTLPLLSPSTALFFSAFHMSTDAQREWVQNDIKSRGGFLYVILNMMVHEIYHVQSGDDQLNNLSGHRSLIFSKVERESVVKQLETDEFLKALLERYIQLIFDIGDNLKNLDASNEKPLLADLRMIIEALKSKYPVIWKFIWDTEYEEGFAEYVATFSIGEIGVKFFNELINFTEDDHLNNFTYRTGTLGGLYLAQRLKTMPFKNNEDQKESVWEIILRLTQTEPSPRSIESILSERGRQGFDGPHEIEITKSYIKYSYGM